MVRGVPGGLVSVAASFTLALTFACSVFAGKGNNKMVVTDADDKKEVKVASGSELEVRLPSSLGTGHSWQLEQVDAAKVAKLGQTEESSESKPGAPGVTVFRLRAAAPGSTPLEFKLVQPFNKNDPPLRVFRITLVVQ